MTHLSSINNFLGLPWLKRTLRSVSISFPTGGLVADDGLASLAQRLKSVQSLRLNFQQQDYKVLFQADLPNISSIHLTVTPGSECQVRGVLSSARTFLYHQSRRIKFSLEVNPGFIRPRELLEDGWLRNFGFELDQAKWVYTVRRTLPAPN